MVERRDQAERLVGLTELGERLSSLRLRSPEAVSSVRQSLVRHGQLTALVAYPDDEGGLEILDGFKRVQAGRELGWDALRVRTLALDGIRAKAALLALHRPHGLTELEEGWLVRSLYRDHGLNQPQIGQLLERHKSWVCRRLMLVEQLDDAVQADVRLGLLAARTAVELCRLPHGNQHRAARVVARRGLTTRQTEHLVAELLAAPDEAQRRQVLEAFASGRTRPADGAGRGAPRPESSPAVTIVRDVGVLRQVAARLEARLLERPLCALGPAAEAAIRDELEALRPVLDALRSAVNLSCNSNPEDV